MTYRNAWAYPRLVETLGKLDRSIPLHHAHACEIERILNDGCKYTNEDWDVNGGARSDLNRTDVRPWEAAWVARWQNEKAA